MRLQLHLNFRTQDTCIEKYADSPFSLITSIRMSITINVPVRPIPALKEQEREVWVFHASRQCLVQKTESSFISVFDLLCTCSVPLSVQHLECSPVSGWPPLRSRAHRRGQWGLRDPARPWSGTARPYALCCPGNKNDFQRTGYFYHRE